LKLGENVLVVSELLWKEIHNWFGGGPILKWKLETDDASDMVSTRS
jgi:hypothetical protein